MHLAMQMAVQHLGSQLHIDTAGLESGVTCMRHGIHMVHVNALTYISMTSVFGCLFA